MCKASGQLDLYIMPSLEIWGKGKMKKKILIGSIIAVALLTLVSFSSVVGYSSVENTQDNIIITDEYDSYTPIQLVFQLISKLRNNKEIQQLVADDEVDIQKEISNIVERDDELNNLIEEIKGLDCGCEEDSSELGGSFSFICWILFPFIFLGILLLPIPIIGRLFIDLLGVIGNALNCFWYPN